MGVATVVVHDTVSPTANDPKQPLTGTPKAATASLVLREDTKAFSGTAP